MMWWNGDDWNGWAWLAMSLSMIVFWGMLIVGVVLVVRHSRADAPGREDPEDILRARFARGEIDAEEYQRRQDLLRR